MTFLSKTRHFQGYFCKMLVLQITFIFVPFKPISLNFSPRPKSKNKGNFHALFVCRASRFTDCIMTAIIHGEVEEIGTNPLMDYKVYEEDTK